MFNFTVCSHILVCVYVYNLIIRHFCTQNKAIGFRIKQLSVPQSKSVCALGCIFLGRVRISVDGVLIGLQNYAKWRIVGFAKCSIRERFRNVHRLSWMSVFARKIVYSHILYKRFWFHCLHKVTRWVTLWEQGALLFHIGACESQKIALPWSSSIKSCNETRDVLGDSSRYGYIPLAIGAYLSLLEPIWSQDL